MPPTGAGHRAVPGEGKDLPGIAGHVGKPAEQHGADNDQQQELGGALAERVDENLHRRRLGTRRMPVVTDRIHQRQHEDQPGDRGVADRPHDALGRVDRCLHGFFGHVETAVETSEGPAGDEQTQHSAKSLV